MPEARVFHRPSAALALPAAHVGAGRRHACGADGAHLAGATGRDTKLTWIIGKLEAQAGRRHRRRRVPRLRQGRGLARIQRSAQATGRTALRRAAAHAGGAAREPASARCVRAPLRIGYDRARSKDLHGLFVNRRIAARSGEHVLDAMASFLEPLGLQADTSALGYSDSAPRPRIRRTRIFPAMRRRCWSARAPVIRLRNWQPERYAAVMDHAAAARLARRAVRRTERIRARRSVTAIAAKCKKYTDRPDRQGHAQAIPRAGAARRPAC